MAKKSTRRKAAKKTTKPNTHVKAEQKRTAQAKKRLILHLKKSLGIITNACKSAKLGRTVFYDWVQADPEFRAKCDEIQEEQLDFVEGVLLKNIRKQKEKSIIFYMRTKGRFRGYSERIEVQEAPPIENFDDYQDQELRTIQKIKNAVEKRRLKRLGG